MEGWGAALSKAIESSLTICGADTTQGLPNIDEDTDDLLLTKEATTNTTLPSTLRTSLRTRRISLEPDEQIEILGSFSSVNSQSVKFDQIEILEFSRRPGDNPSVKFGAPIALGERVLSKTTKSVDEYEQEKPTKLSRDEMFLQGTERMKLLKESGYGGKEIMKSIKESGKERESRKKAKDKFLKKLGNKNALSFKA
jgi:hypothetical protein